MLLVITILFYCLFSNNIQIPVKLLTESDPACKFLTEFNDFTGGHIEDQTHSYYMKIILETFQKRINCVIQIRLWSSNRYNPIKDDNRSDPALWF